MASTPITPLTLTYCHPKCIVSCNGCLVSAISSTHIFFGPVEHVQAIPLVPLAGALVVDPEVQRAVDSIASESNRAQRFSIWSRAWLRTLVPSNTQEGDQGSYMISYLSPINATCEVWENKNLSDLLFQKIRNEIPLNAYEWTEIARLKETLIPISSNLAPSYYISRKVRDLGEQLKLRGVTAVHWHPISL